MTIWYSSDPHFGHANIIRFCNRPFKDVAEMDEFIIARHNEYVKPSDHWWCLGDVTMMRDTKGLGLEILARMNGHKRLIMGNHDQYGINHYVKWFEKVKASWRHDDILFTHIPVHPSSMGSASANVHGHIHNNQPNAFPPVVRIDKATQKVSYHPYINISMEVMNYRPVSLEEIKAMIKKEKGELEGVKVGPEVL